MKGKGDANENFSDDQQTGQQAGFINKGVCLGHDRRIVRYPRTEGHGVAERRFVNMPSTSYKDANGETKYSDIFHAITKAARNALNQAVLNAYDMKLQQVQQTEIEVENTSDEEIADEPEISMG